MGHDALPAGAGASVARRQRLGIRLACILLATSLASGLGEALEPGRGVTWTEFALGAGLGIALALAAGLVEAARGRARAQGGWRGGLFVAASCSAVSCAIVLASGAPSQPRRAPSRADEL